METKVIDRFEKIFENSSYWQSYFEKLGDRGQEKTREVVIMSLLHIVDWLNQNRKDACFCPDCDHECHLKDSFPCKNQHLKDLSVIINYWDYRITEEAFKKEMGIGYDFLNDRWENE